MEVDFGGEGSLAGRVVVGCCRLAGAGYFELGFLAGRCGWPSVQSRILVDTFCWAIGKQD